MNYIKYYPVDVINGEGTRCTLFVSGCSHQCRGCYNKSSWSINAGSLFTTELADKIIEDLQDKRIPKQGLSLTGGDPLLPDNLESVLELVKRVKETCPDKDIWLWTGYTLPELSSAQSNVLKYIDVLIDGKYEEALKDTLHPWRGSTNQQVHYL